MKPLSQLAAYVLHSRRYGDSSLIVELLTREQGRIACVARGALRAHRREPRLQPFQALQVDLRGRGEVLTLTRVEAMGLPLPLRGRVLYCGLYLNELLMRLTARQDPLPKSFDDYQQSLNGLVTDALVEPVLRRFEVRLLQHLGLGLALQNDVDGSPIDPDRDYLYEIDSGARPVAGGQTGAVSGTTLQALHDGSFDKRETLLQARSLMRRIIDYHLDGRPLRSRELFR